MCYVICHKIYKATFKRLSTGVDPGFQVIGGVRALKKNCTERREARKLLARKIVTMFYKSGADPWEGGGAPDAPSPFKIGTNMIFFCVKS
jgi:hypothetical protein